MRKAVYVGLLVLVAYFVLCEIRSTYYVFPRFEIGTPIDSLHGVYVYYNGRTGNVCGRRLAPDGYNLGLKYQCVEFVKRYYYERFRHKMPDASGHARDFFDPHLADGALNKSRNLVQYRNGSPDKPRPGDLLVFGPTARNPYGHVAIVASVFRESVEIVQQNGGAWVRPRVRLGLQRTGAGWWIEQENLMGWLRRKSRF